MKERKLIQKENVLIFVSIISLPFVFIIRISFSPCDAATSHNDSYINGILLHSVTVYHSASNTYFNTYVYYNSTMTTHWQDSHQKNSWNFPLSISNITQCITYCSNIICILNVYSRKIENQLKLVVRSLKRCVQYLNI